jgi:hypothetical protein
MATRRKNLPRLDTAAAAQRGAWVSRGRGWRVEAMTFFVFCDRKDLTCNVEA